MRATGIVRRMDDLGRVVIPKEIRRSMGVQEGDALEMYIAEEGGLCLVPYRSGPVEEINALRVRLNTYDHCYDDANKVKKLLAELETIVKEW